MMDKLVSHGNNNNYHSRQQNLAIGFDYFFSAEIRFANSISNTHRDCPCGLDGNPRSGFSEVQVFIPLLEIRTICKIG